MKKLNMSKINKVGETNVFFFCMLYLEPDVYSHQQR